MATSEHAMKDAQQLHDEAVAVVIDTTTSAKSVASESAGASAGDSLSNSVQFSSARPIRSRPIGARSDPTLTLATSVAEIASLPSVSASSDASVSSETSESSDSLMVTSTSATHLEKTSMPLGLRASMATQAVAGRSLGGTTIRELALSHHWPEQHERCTVVNGHHVCRRCSVLYPITLLVIALGLVGLRWPTSLDRLLFALLPVPLVIDYVAEHLGMIRYSAKRQIATTALAAPALGIAFVRYLQKQTDPLFWSMVAAYGALCFAAFIGSHIRAKRLAARLQDDVEANDPLVHGFEDKDAFLRYLETGGQPKSTRT